MMRNSIVASMAAMPERIKSFQLTIDSIINQVDVLNVYLNNWDVVPDFLSDKKINIFRSQESGDLGDAGKFYPLKFFDGYFFTLDDDLVYPLNYVSTMIEKINQYNRKSFICVHGNKLPDYPLKSYYYDKKGVHFTKELIADLVVDVPGTGTLAFHSSLYSVCMNDFKKANMSDIWLYAVAKEEKIPVVSIERKKYWLYSSIQGEDTKSIYSRFKDNDIDITNLVNSIKFGEI